MESLSRVKKNAELRQEIENSRESELTSTALSSYANRLNRINPQLIRIATSSQHQEYNPLHAKGELERNFDPDNRVEDPVFHHDMLDEFIDEVKSYNIKKGYSSSADTDLNILNRIAQPVLDSNPTEDDQITQEIKRVIEHDFEAEDTDSESESKSLSTVDVFEETAKIKLKLENVDKELLEMSQSVSSSSKTLNFIVFVLVVVLLVLLGFAFYWIFMTQGF